MNPFDIVHTVFSGVWGLFSGTMVPGFGFSYGSVLVSIILIKVSLSLIRASFGFGGSGTNYRSGSAKNPKISKERKGDEH